MKGLVHLADSPDMDGQPKGELQVQREAQFIENLGAFMRRDFAAVEGAWRPDVIMEMPGSSVSDASRLGWRKGGTGGSLSTHRELRDHLFQVRWTHPAGRPDPLVQRGRASQTPGLPQAKP
jgi:hypothetical protein